MPRVTRAPIVDTDLLEIWLYIAADNPKAADGLLDRIAAACEMLARSPAPGERDRSWEARSAVTPSVGTSSTIGE